jgi:4-diphosphocytidyl-2-C-methyl-D-erythritol kinase
MIGFPFAKINLGLSVLSKRADGFHELETVFYPVRLCDVLECTPASASRFFSYGLPLPAGSGDNLVWRASRLLADHFPQIKPLEIHLFKAIPSGAGLGGGSSDAACMLGMMNDYFKLDIPTEKLASFALTLGSDCPFFLKGLPCFAGGRGEVLEPVSLDLSEYSFLIVHPEIHISTAWAFSQIRPATPLSRIRDVLSLPVSEWRDRLVNDFEVPVFLHYPQLQKIKRQLYEAGALYASMTGSGSGIYGLFKKNALPPKGIDTEARQSFLH